MQYIFSWFGFGKIWDLFFKSPKKITLPQLLEEINNREEANLSSIPQVDDDDLLEMMSESMAKNEVPFDVQNNVIMLFNSKY